MENITDVEHFLKLYSGVSKYRYMIPLFTSGVKHYGLKSTDTFVIKKKPSGRLAVLDLAEISGEENAVVPGDQLVAIID